MYTFCGITYKYNHADIICMDGCMHVCVHTHTYISMYEHISAERAAPSAVCTRELCAPFACNADIHTHAWYVRVYHVANKASGTGAYKKGLQHMNCGHICVSAIYVYAYMYMYIPLDNVAKAAIQARLPAGTDAYQRGAACASRPYAASRRGFAAWN